MTPATSPPPPVRRATLSPQVPKWKVEMARLVERAGRIASLGRVLDTWSQFARCAAERQHDLLRL
jgi:hypothetical protein